MFEASYHLSDGLVPGLCGDRSTTGSARRVHHRATTGPTISSPPAHPQVQPDRPALTVRPSFGARENPGRGPVPQPWSWPWGWSRWTGAWTGPARSLACDGGWLLECGLAWQSSWLERLDPVGGVGDLVTEVPWFLACNPARFPYWHNRSAVWLTMSGRVTPPSQVRPPQHSTVESPAAIQGGGDAVEHVSFNTRTCFLEAKKKMFLRENKNKSPT